MSKDYSNQILSLYLVILQKKKKKGLYLVNVFIFYFQFLVFKKKRERKLLCFQIVKQVWLVEKNFFFFFELHAPITSLCQHYCGSTLLRASLQFTRQKYRDQNNTKFNPEKGKMK